jgi:hypothetical protein
LGAVVAAFVKGQEPGRFAFEMRAEHHLGVVHGEMDHATAEFEQLLTWIAVTLVLLDGVLDGLFG